MLRNWMYEMKYLTHKVEISDIQNFIFSKNNYIFSGGSIDLLKDMRQTSQSFIVLGTPNHHSFILNSQFYNKLIRFVSLKAHVGFFNF